MVHNSSQELQILIKQISRNTTAKISILNIFLKTPALKNRDMHFSKGGKKNNKMYRSVISHCFLHLVGLFGFSVINGGNEWICAVSELQKSKFFHQETYKLVSMIISSNLDFFLKRSTLISYILDAKVACKSFTWGGPKAFDLKDFHWAHSINYKKKNWCCYSDVVCNFHNLPGTTDIPLSLTLKQNDFM